jgi:hypothetical protein
MGYTFDLFQTLVDRNNPDDIEEFGPFKCTKNNAWLGHGYYFWDSHIELAHWWGKNSYGKNYIICRASAYLDKTCWDLHGNGIHRNDFKEICEEIIDRGISTKDRLLVAHVIEYLKKNNLFFYKAIRALGVNGVSQVMADKHMVYRLNFAAKSHVYLDLLPAVQVCLIEKSALSLQNYLIVYPEEYVESLY